MGSLERKIAIFGAGGFGRHVLAIIKRINKIAPTYIIAGFYDDAYNKGEIINGVPVLGGVAELNAIDEPMDVVIALGCSAFDKGR